MSRFRDNQWQRLRTLLEGPVRLSSFQRHRLQATGGIEAIQSLESFVDRVPLTTKAELEADQKANPPYGSNFCESLHRYTRFCQTSGTTSRPLSVLDTDESWGWLLENWRLGFEMGGVRPGMVSFFAFSFGPFLGFWTAFEAGLRMGLRCIPGGGLGTVARLRAILEHRAEVLCCTPTYALHLASVAREQGIDLSGSGVRKILVAGEPGGSLPAVRRRLASAWVGAEVIDHYGMTEIGPVAFGVSGRPEALTVLEERYFVEVLNGEGREVEDGAVGQLIVTPLGRSSWPLLRYQTGDLVRVCRTEDGMRLLGGIVGRADDMVIVRGVNLYPGAVEEVIRTHPQVEEYRVTVKHRNGLTEVSLEVEVPSSPSLASELEADFERAFALRIPVREVACGTLPRFELKAKRWIVESGGDD